MIEFIRNFFHSDFMPHGHCYFWDPSVVWLNVVSDCLITLAYYSIPVTLAYLVFKRRDVPFSWMFGMFAGFIVACGTTHLMEVWTVWHGTYRLAGGIKAVTAVLSVSTAIFLVKLLPAAMSLRSPAQLGLLNAELQREIGERKAAESALIQSETMVRDLNAQLERRVEERTAELRESETRFRATFEQAAMGLAHVSPEGRWLRVNQKLCEIVGYTREELLARTFQEITYPDDLQTDLEQVRRLLADEIQTYSLEKRYVCKDGSLAWVNLTVSLVRELSGQPRYFISVVEDITRRKQSESDLAHLATIVESSSDAIISYAADGKILSWNAAAEQLFGYATAEIKGQSFALLLPPDRAEEAPQILSALARGEQFHRSEVQRRRRDGSLIEVAQTISPIKGDDGRVMGASVVARDITERKRADERFRLVVEAAPNAMLMVDATGKMTLVNSQAERLFRYTREELLGQPLEMLVPERYRAGHPTHRAGFFSAPAARPMGAGRDLFGLRKDGTEVPIEIGLNPIQTGEGMFVLASIIDITERTRAAQSIKDSLIEKETLLKEIHHRVKNNMQLVSSLLQLQSRHIKNPEAQTVFRESQNRIRSMALIHEKLYQSSSLAQIDFAGYVRSLVAILMRTYNTKAHAVRVESRVEAVALNLDTAIPFGLVLNELISNALQHAFPGDRRGVIQVSLRHTGDGWLELLVRDDGIGLPSDFDWERSSSLGLRLIRTLSEQLHGRMEVQNQEGVQFRLVFRETRPKEKRLTYG